MTEQTEALKNGAKIPIHPAETTARKIIKYGEVRDAHSDVLCSGGLHRNEIDMLRRGEVGGLAHLHKYCFVQEGNTRRVYHTRPRVIISVETIPIDDGDI
jgi:hypothetical protein